MRTLKISPETFMKTLPELIESGVNFEATEDGEDTITIRFDGGY